MASTDSPAASEATSPTFTLQIISPSVNVPQPLQLTGLSATTTVRQLKEKIRNAIESRPGDSAQRLIHRGRLLSKDDDTMKDVFGEDAIRSTDAKSLHLVLRDLSDARPANVSLPANNTSQPAATTQIRPAGDAPVQPQQQPPLRNANANAHGQFPRLPFPQVHAPHHNLPFGFQQTVVHGGTAQGQAGPHAPFGFTAQGLTPADQAQHIARAQQIAQLQHAQHIAQQQHLQHQRLYMPNMNDPQRLQELINQSQRDRATMGLHGAQDAPTTSTGIPGLQSQNRTASPSRSDGTRTVVREGLGPGGAPWRISVNETVTAPQNPQRNARTGSPFPPPDLQNLFRPPGGAPQPPRSVPLAGPHGGGLSGSDVHNMFRTADAGQAATRVMTDAMRRHTSNSSLFNLANNQATEPIAPGVTVPSRTGSAMGTPDPIRAARSYMRPSSQPQNQLSAGSEVYILSSPEGPRALLVNGNHGTYYTPNHNTQFHVPPQPMPRHYTYQLPGRPVQQGLPLHVPPVVNPWAPPAANHMAQHNQQQQQPQQQAQAQAPLPQGLPLIPQAQPHLGHAAAHPANVQVRAIAVAQIWPHIWMVIRLLLFVWWFTSPTASWQRWFTVIAIAFSLFLVNTGLLTPLAEQFWTPMRRHLDNLMPAADNHGRERPVRAENAPANNVNVGAQGDGAAPNPADLAARLVHERRAANGNWLMNQARRLERAGILFLASIAPGVAERHIANLEAEARAERQRREQAEADEQRRITEQAAEEARQAAENTETGAEATNTEAVSQQGAESGEGARPENPEEPLIAI